MPGSFYGDLSPDRNGSMGGSMTGTGPATQSRDRQGYTQAPMSPTPYGGDRQGLGSQNTVSYNAPPGGGSSNQFPGGQGPLIGGGSLGADPSWNARSQQMQQLGMNPLAGIQGMVDTMYGPQQMLLGQQLARQYDQLGMIGPDVSYRQGALQRDTDLARQGLDIDRKGIGIESGLTKTQLANLDRLHGILGKQFGLNDRTLQNQMLQFGIDEAKVRDMEQRQQWDLRSDLTQRGAFGTIANERGTGRIKRDMAFALGGINTGRTGAKLSHEGNVYGLQEKGIGYDNQGAELGAKLGQLGLDMQRLGLNEQQLTNSLNDGMRQIGLDGYMSVNGLLDAIGGTNSQQSQLATTILNEVLSYANLPPEVLAQIQRALGITPGARSPGTYGGGSYRR